MKKYSICCIKKKYFVCLFIKLQLSNQHCQKMSTSKLLTCYFVRKYKILKSKQYTLMCFLTNLHISSYMYQLHIRLACLDLLRKTRVGECGKTIKSKVLTELGSADTTPALHGLILYLDAHSSLQRLCSSRRVLVASCWFHNYSAPC